MIRSSAAENSYRKICADRIHAEPTPSAHLDTTEHNANVQSAHALQATPETRSHLVSEANVNRTMNAVIIVLASTTGAPIRVSESAVPTQFVSLRDISPSAPAQPEPMAMRSFPAANRKAILSPDIIAR